MPHQNSHIQFGKDIFSNSIYSSKICLIIYNFFYLISLGYAAPYPCHPLAPSMRVGLSKSPRLSIGSSRECFWHTSLGFHYYSSTVSEEQAHTYVRFVCPHGSSKNTEILQEPIGRFIPQGRRSVLFFRMHAHEAFPRFPCRRRDRHC
jgi:hypothetical protein